MTRKFVLRSNGNTSARGVFCVFAAEIKSIPLPSSLLSSLEVGTNFCSKLCRLQYTTPLPPHVKQGLAHTRHHIAVTAKMPAGVAVVWGRGREVLSRILTAAKRTRAFRLLPLLCFVDRCTDMGRHGRQ